MVRCSPGRLFDLQLDTELHTRSMGPSRETATTSTGQHVLALGDEVTFRARHLGLVWRMTSRVTAFDRPHRFVDEQVRGPFARMRHEHVFEALDASTTRMTDRMVVVAPLGAVGRVVERTVLDRYLQRLLRGRAEHVRRVAEGA